MPVSRVRLGDSNLLCRHRSWSRCLLFAGFKFKRLADFLESRSTLFRESRSSLSANALFMLQRDAPVVQLILLRATAAAGLLLGTSKLEEPLIGVCMGSKYHAATLC